MPTKTTTIFIDRCLGGVRLAKAIHGQGITVEVHDDHFPQDALDKDWLPEVGKKGWLVLTADENIGRRQIELFAVNDYSVKLFVFVPSKMNARGRNAIIVDSLLSIVKVAEKNQAPFIAKIYRDSRIEIWKDSQELNSYRQNLFFS